MPELPEIETICRELSKKLPTKTFKQIKFLRADLRIPFPKDVKNILNKEIISIERRAKFIQINLSNVLKVIIHLGMTGKILFKSSNYQPIKHDHALFYLSDDLVMVYNDVRRFGLITICEDKHSKHYKNFGPEPFSSEFNVNYFQNFVQNKSLPIKPLLMNNELVVGVGNIYACEALFKSRIDPSRKAKSLTKEEISRLIKEIINVLYKAIELGGSTLRDYINTNEQKGNFQNEFLVYGKEKETCVICDSEIKRIRQAGRSTFFCPSCQK